MKPLTQIITFLAEVCEFDQANSLLETFEKYANTIEHYDELAQAYSIAKMYDKAIEILLSMDRYDDVSPNLVNLYNRVNEPVKSLEANDNAVRVSGNNPGLMMDRAFSHHCLADYTTSREITEQLLSIPDLPREFLDRCEFNMATHIMEDGNFKRGYLKFIDMGHRLGIWGRNVPGAKSWQGQHLPGEKLYIVAEGGIGDEILTMRFHKNISELGMIPIFVTTRDDIVQILTRLGIETSKSVPENSNYILSMYLPLALGLDKQDLWSGEYLSPDPTFVEKWKDILPSGKKIGIRWSGNKLYEHDLHRSIPVAVLSTELNFRDRSVTFVSLQKEDTGEGDSYPIMNVSQHLETLEDLIACMSLLDYTVTSCTSVAHIAGACGFRATVAPPISTYHTWLGDIKWYGSNMKIRRQKAWRSFDHLSGIWSDIDE